MSREASRSATRRARPADSACYLLTFMRLAKAKASANCRVNQPVVIDDNGFTSGIW